MLKDSLGPVPQLWLILGILQHVLNMLFCVRICVTKKTGVRFRGWQARTLTLNSSDV